MTNWTAYSTDEITDDLIAKLGVQPVAITKYAKLVDLSDNNGTVNWDLLAPCIDGVIVEANDGGYRNTTFGPNWYNAGVYGLARVAYILCRPSQRTGHDDAMIMLEMLTQNGFNSGDGIALDFEDPGVPGLDLLAYALDCLRTLQADLNVNQPGLYSSISYLSEHKLLNNPELSSTWWWAADWQTRVLPAVPAGWKDWTMWQIGKGPIPGISGYVDFDYFKGSVQDLRALGKP